MKPAALAQWASRVPVKLEARTVNYLSRRLVAGLVDAAVLAGVQFGAVRALYNLFPPVNPASHFSAEGIVLFGILGPLSWWLYAVAPLARTGSTLGKQLVRLRVVNRQGALPTAGQAFLRESVGKWLSSMILYLGFAWPLWDSDRQALHDLMVETYVVIRL
jgi:uncharacterized RDD family membrane protein YckC